MTDRFVKVPLEVLEAPNLGPLDKLVWCAIASFCYNDKPTCFPSKAALGQKVGRQKAQIMRCVRRLKDAGFLTMEKREGRSTEYSPCLPVSCILPVPSGVLPATVPVPPMDQSSALEGTGVVPCTVPEIEQPNKKEKSTPPNPPKGEIRRGPKKSPLLKDPERIREALERLDLAPIKDKYAEVDVDLVFLEFKQVCIEGTAKSDIPNPYNYRNFAKALDGWCLKRMTKYLTLQQGERAAARNPDSPLAATPKLTPEQMQLRDERLANEAAWAEIEASPPEMFEELREAARASPASGNETLRPRMIRLWREGWEPKKRTP